MEVQEKRKLVKVVATKVGYDGVQLRQPGDEFMVSEAYFDKRVRTKSRKDPETGELIEATYYDPPSWFERVDEKPAQEGKKKGGGNAADLV